MEEREERVFNAMIDAGIFYFVGADGRVYPTTRAYVAGNIREAYMTLDKHGALGEIAKEKESDYEPIHGAYELGLLSYLGSNALNHHRICNGGSPLRANARAGRGSAGRGGRR